MNRLPTDLSTTAQQVFKAALSGLPNLVKARSILVAATSNVRALVAQSARKLADIALTAITAGLGPAGKRIMTQLRQAGDVITQVLKNPGQFARNLMGALKQGFMGFVGRSGQWIQKGLGDWLLGSADIQFPMNLDVQGVLMTALSIMDLGYDALRARLVKELGPGAEKRIALLEKSGEALGQLKGNVGKAPEFKAVASQLGGQVIGGITTEVTETLVKKGVQRVALMFNPAGAAIGAIMTAWSTIQTVIDKGKQIMGVIMTALGSVREIAAGNVAGAARHVEQTVGKALPVMFSFAANFLGIGNIGARLRQLVRGMRRKLGIDRLIDRVMARLKKLVGTGRQVAGQAVQTAQGMLRGIFSRKTFRAGKENHSIWFDTKSGKPQLWVASTPREARVQLHYAHREAGVNVRNSGGMVALGGRNYTEAVIDHERDQGEAKISAALNALSGGNFRTLSTREKLDSYFKQLSGAHFNGIEQHFKVLFSVADAHQVSRSQLDRKTFYFNRKPSLNKKEYERQVGFASTELKGMSVELFLKRRTQTLLTNNIERGEMGVVENGRDYQENGAMTRIRREAVGRLQVLITATKDGTITPAEKTELGKTVKLLRDSLRSLRKYRNELAAKPNPGVEARKKIISLGDAITRIEGNLSRLDPAKIGKLGKVAVRQVSASMVGALALLHSLDQIGGGSGVVFPGPGLDAYGIARVNSSIGATWKTLAVDIENYVRQKVSPGHYAAVSMSPITLSVR